MFKRERIERLTVAEFRIIALSFNPMLRQGGTKESCFTARTGAAHAACFMEEFPHRDVRTCAGTGVAPILLGTSLLAATPRCAQAAGDFVA
jgi:hypothetical protein